LRLVSFLALQQHSGFTILRELRTVLTVTALAAYNNTNLKLGHWSETQPGAEAQIVATSSSCRDIGSEVSCIPQ